MARASDRWITPGVIISAIISAAVVILGIGAGLVWLAHEGVDTEPVLDLVSKVVLAVGSAGSFMLSLATRQASSRTERYAGRLAYHLTDPPETGRHSAPEHGAALAGEEEKAA